MLWPSVSECVVCHPNCSGYVYVYVYVYICVTKQDEFKANQTVIHVVIVIIHLSNTVIWPSQQHNTHDPSYSAIDGGLAKMRCCNYDPCIRLD